MTPSARTGTITINFSKPVLSPFHIGTIFRYAGRQMLVTFVASAYQASATVIELLPPSFAVTVDNLNGLQVGDVVEGITSGAKGQVAEIFAGVPIILVDKNWNGFEVGEVMVGPRSKMEVVSQTAAGAVASTQWDEALMSDYRGWPGCVTKDAQRIISAGSRRQARPSSGRQSAR